MKNAISWFEIPSVNLERAQRFYETIFNVQLFPLDVANIRMRMFPIDDPATGIGGAVVHAEGFYQPSPSDGVLVYLNGNPDVQIILDRVEAAGGQVIVPKTEISPEYGHMGIFVDTEGNRIGLHSIPVYGARD
jgi:predicted enzyme related to lactoylglutathione lyase